MKIYKLISSIKIKKYMNKNIPIVTLVKRYLKIALNKYIEYLCEDEYQLQSFKKFNERPVEIGFLFKAFL